MRSVYIYVYFFSPFISALLNYIKIFQYVGKVVKVIEKMGGGGLGILTILHHIITSVWYRMRW